ncbi:MAG: DHH family phosphoesterase [Bacilli bacterium]|nr:DHH family phosphoesterase [Bacilli bacterium]
MGRKIRIFKTIAFILILVEIVLIAAFCVFYFNNIFDLKDLIKVEYLVIGCSSLAIIDCLFIWISMIVISSLRQKTDLRAAEVIGNDIQEAYNFAQIGLAVTDDTYSVMWTNDIFKDRHLDVIDENILEWQPALKELADVTSRVESTKVEINNRTYEVKLIQEAGLWIFKDVTDYESIFKYSKEQAPVVGILAIDNYDDVIRGEDDFNEIVTEVKNTIFGYAKEFGFLLKRIKDDNYFIVCNYEAYTAILEDNFSVIDRVRKIGNGEDVPLTLSIGFALDFPDVNKLHELALAALDIAMSRGGDQVVVSAYGKEMEFFGGKSEAQEKRSRVKIRVLADSLIGLIKSTSNVLIMGHTNMDMDAFGACLGVKAICDRLNKPSKIVVDYKATEFKTRACITSSFGKDELDKTIVNTKDVASFVKTDTLLIVVDVHIPSMVMYPPLLDSVAKIVVIDHHRRAEEYIDSLSLVFNHIDPASSSTCELISEFIRFSSINPRIELSPMYATIMLAGIFLDSSFFKSRNTGVRTFEAATILKEYGADNSMADDFLKDDYEEHKEVSDIVARMETPEYGVVVAVADPNRLFDTATIAKAANECLTFKGNHASFVIGKTGPREVRMSCRSDGSINVQLLAEKLGGGGHFSSSAVSFNKANCDEVKQEVLAVISKYLKAATSAMKNMEVEED